MKAITIELLDIKPMHLTTALRNNYKIFGKRLFNESGNGYLVTYPNGNKIWYYEKIAKNKFFILNSTNDGSLIKEEDVKNFIDRYTAITIGEKTTLVHAKTVTGFEMIESSSCVDAKNYSKELGTKYAMENVINKLWSNLGFVLQWAKNGINKTNFNDK